MNTNLIINGTSISGTAALVDVINPADETVLISVPSASEEQINDAIEAAQVAFKSWKNSSDEQIKSLFANVVADIRAEKDDIARLITLEQGKPLPLAQFEVDAGAAWIEYVASLEIPVDTMQDPTGKQIEIHHRPVGVVASVTPWNWPFMIAIWHLFPALKAKNCIINKPSEYTPLSTIKLVEIINRHLPAGVCSVVLGKGEVGQQLTQHPDIAKVTFTGSTRTGQHILSNSVSSLKSVVLELGGNDAGIVLDDVNVKDVAAKIFGSAFLNAGQTCAALKRLYVHDSIYDALTEELKQIAQAQVVGAGLDANTTFGPVQNKAQYDKVKALIADAQAQGANVITPQAHLADTGYYIAPTLVTNIQEGTALVDEEQFGPALPIIKYTDLDEVITRANNTDFGLGASVWSSDVEKARTVANQLEAGTVWINSHADVSPMAVFGGWKQSGLGYSFGLDGLLLFTQKQALHITQ